MRHNLFAMGALMALGGAGMIAASPSVEPDSNRQPERTRHKPSGNTPVSGGGKRERERRLARMAKQQQD